MPLGPANILTYQPSFVKFYLFVKKCLTFVSITGYYCNTVLTRGDHDYEIHIDKSRHGRET